MSISIGKIFMVRPGMVLQHHPWHRQGVIILGIIGVVDRVSSSQKWIDKVLSTFHGSLYPASAQTALFFKMSGNGTRLKN